jgi:hypothetical protein
MGFLGPMMLMPVSQAVAWWLVFRGDSLFESVFKIASFYCLWALYNRYVAGLTKEKGHISQGILALTSYFNLRNYSILAALLVILNFAAGLGICLQHGPRGLAKFKHKSTTGLPLLWALILIAYMMSNIALWSNVAHRLYWDMPSDGYFPIQS